MNKPKKTKKVTTPKVPKLAGRMDRRKSASGFPGLKPPPPKKS